MQDDIKNYEWYKKNRENLLKEYKDKVIAVWNSEIVAYGNDGGKVLDECREKYPESEPFITVVEELGKYSAYGI